VNFTVEGNNRSYAAVIMASESGIAETTRSLTMRARLQGGEAGLVPGAFAKVKISFSPDTGALLIPTQAIIPQARGKKVYVYRGGIADFVDVTTGIRDSSQVQIVSGLAKGDTVIITGLLGLKPKAKVVVKRVINEGTSTTSVR
jgi:membrane fusion protein (multidrug efflux system)